LGQGFANGVGMAIAERHLAAVFNKPGHEIIDHYTYAIVTDGDLMEGVASEAASLAGHLMLGKIIYLYDDNHISIEGSTEVAFTEDRAARFDAYGWHIQKIADGNDIEAVDAAIRNAKRDPRPSIILCRTHIGFGLPTRQDTAKAHGEAPGDEELNGAKTKLGWPLEPRFYIPDDVGAFFCQAVDRGTQAEVAWKTRFEAYRAEYPELAAELERRLAGDLPAGWDEGLPEFPADPKGIATRAASGKVLNALAVKLPELVGGSADLAPSTLTWLTGSPSFQPSNPEGRNLQFGVREHAMGAIVNGMAYHGGLIPYGSTFFVFTDYMRPPIRLAALSHLKTVWVFTHDSIGVGEDGPTHEPVEHLAAMRAIPNLVVIRPGDANEVREAWKTAVSRKNAPVLLVLSRQPLITFDRAQTAPAANAARGAYVLADLGGKKPEVILMASGTEVQIVYDAAQQLAAAGTPVRVVSFPSWELFAEQDEAYQKSVLPDEIKARLAMEAGIGMGWERWVGDNGKILSIEHFGASAPYQTIYENFGMTAAHVVKMVNEMQKA
jgi:transketolase